MDDLSDRLTAVGMAHVMGEEWTEQDAEEAVGREAAEQGQEQEKRR
jgi:hypothetical protein